MVSIHQIGIRYETSQLNVAKQGATALYVDTNHPAANDDNDGYSWDMPLKTIMGAMRKAQPWTEIWVRGGDYYESVTIDKDNIKLIGAVEDGSNRVAIHASETWGLKIEAAYCDISQIAIITTNADGVVVSYPGNRLSRLYIDLSSLGVSTKCGIRLNDADRCIIENCIINGDGNKDYQIGVLVANGSVDDVIRNCTISGMGETSELHAGYGVGLYRSQRALVEHNTISNCGVGVYIYQDTPVEYQGHAVINNMFSENYSYDVFDPTTNQLVTGNMIDGNFYAYEEWFRDSNHDGIADIVVDCYNNRDYHPLANPNAWKTIQKGRSKW